MVLWALVNEEVEQRLAAGNAKMRPQDWRSGEKLWVVGFLDALPARACLSARIAALRRASPKRRGAPPPSERMRAGRQGRKKAMLQDLKTQVFPERTFKFRAVVDGKPGVQEM